MLARPRTPGIAVAAGAGFTRLLKHAKVLESPWGCVHDWLVLIHVVAAMVWLGSVLTVILLAAHALRRGESEAIELFLQGLETTWRA
jgi:putative copper export protein